MRRANPWLALVAIAVVGCGDDRAAVENAAIEEDVQALENRLEASMGPMVNVVSLGAIRNAGHDCAEIAVTGERSRRGSELTWTARCSEGGEWVIVARDDGSHQVMTPAEAAERGIQASPPAAGGE